MPLVNELIAKRDELTAQVLAAELRDPFWEERYGERARRRGREDNDFHVSYLIEAIEAGTAASLEQYALWLRTLLTHRGMCSWQLDENFRLLADAIVAAQVSDADAAVAYLDKARAVLKYRDGDAGALDAAAPALAETLRAQLASAHPELRPHAERLGQDLVQQLSYLADALASGNAAGYRDYAGWSQGWWRRAGLPTQVVDALPAALEAALAAHPAAQQLVAEARRG